MAEKANKHHGGIWTIRLVTWLSQLGTNNESALGLIKFHSQGNRGSLSCMLTYVDMLWFISNATWKTLLETWKSVFHFLLVLVSVHIQCLRHNYVVCEWVCTCITINARCSVHPSMLKGFQQADLFDPVGGDQIFDILSNFSQKHALLLCLQKN